MKNCKIFVIMPFVSANGRAEADLTSFFNDYIRLPIEENRELDNSYSVIRSGNSLAMLDKIIEDIASADVVICDLSGEAANPNVMFELGLRLATSAKPTILIREDHPDNKRIFDVNGLFTFPYKVTRTRDLERFLIDKLKEYEKEPDVYESPVLKVLNQRAAFWMTLPIRKASAFLGGIASAAESCLIAFARALELHYELKGKIVRIENPMTVYRMLQDADDEKKLQLEDFGYVVTSIPSLDSYLSSIYLLGLIEDDVEKEFRSHAMAYALNFNRGNSSFFAKSRYEEFLMYSYETLLLMNLSRIIINILDKRQGSSERTQLVEKFFNTVKDSQFYKVEG